MIRQRIPIDIRDVLIIECQGSCLDKVVDPSLQCSAIFREVSPVTEMVITSGILVVPSGYGSCIGGMSIGTKESSWTSLGYNSVYVIGIGSNLGLSC